MVGAITEIDFVKKHNIADVCRDFLRDINIDAAVKEAEEITGRRFYGLLRAAESNSFIMNQYKITSSFDIADPRSIPNNAEGIVDKSYTLAKAAKEADAILYGESLVPEIERIFTKSAAPGFAGHPVHYTITATEKDMFPKIYKLLLGSLWSNNRIISRRYMMCTMGLNRRGDFSDFEDEYKSMAGGTIILNCAYEESDSDFAEISRGQVDSICAMIKKYRQTVLTVLCFERSNEKMKNSFMDNLANLTFVELSEEIVFPEKAKKYLKMCAKEKGAKNCAALYKMLPKSEKGYLTSDLNRIFDTWYDKYMKTDIYSQYAALESKPAEIAKPKGDAYRILQEMIGLTQAKAVLAQAIDYYKAQKLFKEKGVQNERPAMHMIFTGNPGTAKTSVARLIAQIMKDNNLLSVGDLIEVGRADLVGKYLGHTAPLVKSKFKQAKGSVLFIDEAYSLVDDRDGLYGDEAINTIVQQMENTREDTVVIFAGYPDKMEGFLQKNPGLRSRIAFHVEFPDYTVDELMDITRLMVKNQKLTLADDAEEKIMGILCKASTQEDYGNGRFVRNMLERARMNQATRLVKMDFDAVTPEIATTLAADDFEMPALKTNQKLAIGF